MTIKHGYQTFYRIWLISLLGLLTTACGGSEEEKNGNDSTSSVVVNAEIKPEVQIIDKLEKTNEITQVAVEPDGTTRLVVSGDSALADSVTSGSTLYIPPSVDPRFPFGIAAKVESNEIQNDSSHSLALSAVTLADVVTSAQQSTQTVKLDADNFVGVISPSAIQPSDAVVTAADNMKSLSLDTKVALNGGVVVKNIRQFQRAAAGTNGSLSVGSDISLNLKLSLKGMGVDISKVNGYGTETTPSIEINGVLKDLKLTSELDFDMSSGLKSMNYSVEGDLQAETKISMDGKVDFGYYSQAWKEVEEQQIKMLGVSGKFTGLDSKDKIGKYPVVGLVWTIPCPQTCIFSGGKTQTPLRMASATGGVIIWVYMDAKGTLSLTGESGVRINGGHLTFGLKKESKGELAGFSSLTPTQNGHLAELPFLKGKASAGMRLGTSFDLDAFVTGVRFANASANLVTDMNISSDGEITNAIDKIGDDFNWYGQTCVSGGIGAGIIAAASVSIGVKMDSSWKNIDAGLKYTKQWPKEDELNQPGKHDLWINFLSLNRCYPAPIIRSVATTLVSSKYQIKASGEYLPSDITLKIKPLNNQQQEPLECKEETILQSSESTFTCPSFFEGKTIEYLFSSKKAENLSYKDATGLMYSPPMAANLYPIANAGADITVNQGEAINLNAAGSRDTDGQIISYQWLLDGHPVSNEQEFQLKGVSVGTHLVTLKVTDNDGDVAGDNLQLVVLAENKAPTANAGVDITINDGEVVNLDGSVSRDPDGSIASYEWWLNGQLQGSSSRISLSKLAVGSHVVTLIVKDNQGLVDSDTVTIVVKALPPRLDVSASILDFGSVAYDISGARFSNKTLTISNSGGQPLTNIKLVLASNNNVFTLNDASSFTLAPGASRVVTLSAVAKTISDFTGSLQVTADGGFSKSISLKAAVIANNLVHRVIPSASALLVNDALTLRIEMTNGNPEYAISVNWGDGQTGSYSTTSDVMSASHTYTKAFKGTIQVTVNDFAGKTGLTTLPISVSDEASLISQWYAQAHHIETDETATDVPIQISEQTLSGNLVQRYTTSWAPASGSNNEYFIKYRLPVPAGLIKLDRKMRMTVVMSASSIAAFDRELAFVTDQGEMLASWRGETEPALPGYLQYKPIDGGTAQVTESVALNDDPQVNIYQSYAVELNNQQFDAQSYANNSYSSLANLAINGGIKLNELNITFKGNGAISLVKFEYDANNNGVYDDGAIFANTADKTVDWSVYSGITPPVTTVAGHLNDTGITSCMIDGSNSHLPCPAAGFPGQDAESGRDATANDDSDGHAGFSFTKLDSNGQPLTSSATEWSCVKDNVTGLIWEIHTDHGVLTKDGGLRDKGNTYSWYNPDSTTNGGDAGTQNGGSCIGGIACDTWSYVTAINAQGLCGYHDWRLPTVTELQGLVDYSVPRFSNSAIDMSYFPDTRQGLEYWSSSTAAGNNSNAWVVYFDFGDTEWSSKLNNLQLRLVRSGQ